MTQSFSGFANVVRAAVNTITVCRIGLRDSTIASSTGAVLPKQLANLSGVSTEPHRLPPREASRQLRRGDGVGNVSGGLLKWEVNPES